MHTEVYTILLGSFQGPSTDVKLEYDYYSCCMFGVCSVTLTVCW